ncbi:MAG TPA: GTP cyclohydrolase I FolE [Sphingomicrobium sp.]|nr:GTP cyclohydrolase I FolE [Sphingomicrobium sp.]
MNLSSYSEFEVPELDETPSVEPKHRPGRAEIEQAIRTLLAATGDDPSREGLQETPARVARAYSEWFAGYYVDPKSYLDRVFEETEGYEETVLLRDIPLVSTCEHHMAPITGKAHVAYRPNGKVVGISKLSRLVDDYARRLQLQERLTNEIAKALDEVLQPKGVAVIVEASHGCMTTRGVNQHGISMVTKCWLGDFKSDESLRRELIDSIRGC